MRKMRRRGKRVEDKRKGMLKIGKDKDKSDDYRRG